MTAAADLRRLVLEWEASGTATSYYHFPLLLEEILFQGETRYRDYIQYQTEGEFSTRLKQWLGNVSGRRQQQALLRLLDSLVFIDRGQMTSLYRDAYRRLIVPWISLGQLSVQDVLAPDYELRIREILLRYRVCAITQSFSFPEFEHANDLSGIPKGVTLGEKPRALGALFPPPSEPLTGIILLEDFVGTGNQARRVLAEVRRLAPEHWRILFIPLLILERGWDTLRQAPELATVTISPGMILKTSTCLPKQPVPGEPPHSKHLRALVRHTAARVLERLNPIDDPPVDAFGYGGCGAMLVTCHNTPNNTLPLIHHRAPAWAPLFRRVHHSKDG